MAWDALWGRFLESSNKKGHRRDVPGKVCHVGAMHKPMSAMLEAGRKTVTVTVGNMLRPQAVRGLLQISGAN